MSVHPSVSPAAESCPSSSTSNPHLLWRQWLGMTISTLFVLLFGLPGFLVALMGWLVFADAWRSGIYKRPDKRAFLNLSPMGWGVASQLFMIVAFPCYLIFRSRLRTRESDNQLFIAAVVLATLQLALLVVSIVATVLDPTFATS